jgi:hypothetical protein
MTATLTVLHEASMGIELRRAPLEVVLDGTTVGSIKRHETFETEIEPGHHELQIRAGRYFSPRESFDVADGDGVNFRCYPAMLWPRVLISFVVPSLGVSLTRG